MIGTDRISANPFDTSMVSMDSHDFKMFRELIHRKTGIWLRDGKQVMLASRLSRRLRHLGIGSFGEYLSYVERISDDGGEMREFINCVTTNKTSFFREEHHFDFLAQTIVPALRREGKCIRIWSACCSTGEEPYSIAMTVLEALRMGGGTVNGPVFQVVASDIDTNVLSTAARAIYGQDSLESVPDALRGRYFLRGRANMAGQVRVKPAVARCVEFKRINLMDNAWPIEGPFDAIFFRNALIYFNQKTQELFVRKMLRYLNPKGYLVLGHSEHVPWLHDVVTPLNKTIYRLRDNAG